MPLNRNEKKEITPPRMITLPAIQIRVFIYTKPMERKKSLKRDGRLEAAID